MTDSDEEGDSDGETDSDEQEEDSDPDEETAPENEDANIVLPPDSSGLFKCGIIGEHNFAESTFTEGQVGTDVSEFNLANADTSNVIEMNEMFSRAESFNQDIGGWDTSNVT